MNTSNTRLTPTAFVERFPQLFQRYVDLMSLAYAHEAAWRNADTARFDESVKITLQAVEHAAAAAQEGYLAGVADERSLMEQAHKAARDALNAKLEQLLTTLANDEAPLLQERDQALASLEARLTAFRMACVEFEIQATAHPYGAELQAAANDAKQRCEDQRSPLRGRYSADVAEAFQLCNAAVAASSARYAHFENGVALDRKRALKLAEDGMHSALLQIAAERDEASTARLVWFNARKQCRRQALMLLFRNAEWADEAHFGQFLSDETEVHRQHAAERGWTLQ